MKDEINRRLDILNKKKVPMITQRMMRGGMQERLHRQEILSYGGEIVKQKKKLNKRLSLIEQEKLREGFDGFSVSSMEPLDDFHEPTFRRIRSKRGFF